MRSRSILPGVASNSRLRLPGMDFLCPVCGRWVDAKYSGTMVRFGLVRFNCSANPWMHYLPTSTLAIRTAWDRHPSSVSCLRADGRIVEGHAASADGQDVSFHEAGWALPSLGGSAGPGRNRGVAYGGRGRRYSSD